MKSSFLKIAGRIILVSLYAYLVVELVKLALPEDFVYSPPLPKWILAILYFTIFNLNTEGNFVFNRYLNNKLPWFYFPKRRLLAQFGFVLGWSLLTLGTYFTAMFFIHGVFLDTPWFSIIVLISSVVLLICIAGISIAYDSLKQYRITLLEVEQLEKENLIADYKALQNQVNPHFLFNCFNVLLSEIKQDPETAETFTRKLSTVYRYVLQSKNHDLITLEKEVDFIRSYLYLYQVRSGDGLKVTINIDIESLKYSLPPLTLQILVENAIKHNVMNGEDQLHINITSHGTQTLVVKNNLNPKQSFDSTNTGLSNLKARYKLLKEDGFKIEKSAKEFIVTVPLLEE